MKISEDQFITAVNSWILKCESEGDRIMAPLIAKCLLEEGHKEFDHQGYTSYKKFETDFLVPALTTIETSIESLNQFLDEMLIEEE